MLRMELEYKKNILYVRLRGILNKRSSYKINNYLIPLLNKHRIKYLVYNFSKLEMIDKEGIDALIRSKYSIKNNKGKIKVCSVSKNTEYLCKYLKLPVVKNELEAEKIMEMRKC